MSPLYTLNSLVILLSIAKLQKNTWDHLQQVFHKLCNAELAMKLSNCHFYAKEIQYLHHVLSPTGIKPLPSKTAAIKLINPPKNAKQVRAFPGLAGYYCRLIKNFPHIAKSLTALTPHNVKFVWTSSQLTKFDTPKRTLLVAPSTSSQLTAFKTLKMALLVAPILHCPDPSKCYIVYTDSSDDPCRAQLSQEHDGQELPIAFSHTHLQTPNGNGAL